MPINVNWTNPTTAVSSGGIDFATGNTIDEASLDRLVSNLYRYGGSDGNTKTGKLQLGGTATAHDNSFNTAGLTVDMEAADDEGLAVMNDDVAHGVTGEADTRTFWNVRKYSNASGGAVVAAYTEGTIAHEVRGVQTTADTTHTAAGTAAVQLNAALKSGTTVTAVGANGNLFVVMNNNSTRMICDAEGDVFADGSGLTIYDEHDDVALARSYDVVRAREAGARGLIRSRWDDFVQANEEGLIAAGILGGRLREGGLTNYTQLVRLHNGALWQHHTRLEQLREDVDARLVALEGSLRRLAGRQEGGR